ncbi:Acyl-CoA dehydrogenase [Parafrankia irregularis]|uniref:Acyl-CoA dehydrogenase n=1 Tax=Parafrankia irregularis TaxID=795642 RepID=A0A0S4QPI7_9ACTN|nr:MULTISPECIES: acyl-CoA dehydrogenase family protein [Parafrankia]MBE3200598.1 acyl-CoA dehydrogenase family protein [Parafrankia sp. CH37]CUU56930.1 Acyl-CoA dehydrogenase [Parafrankia irregularis]
MSSDEIESVEDFRLRARTWLRENMPRLEAGGGRRLVVRPDEEELAEVAEDRRLQRLLFDGGFAGLCFPKEYGGQGLTPAHAEAFNAELVGYRYPSRLQVPTMTPCAAVIAEFGTEEQKRRHLPAILRGEELWMQFLSEPGAGSDVAGAKTSAVREGDEWVLNGSKIWTTGAWWSDWGLCLARTNWDVPKHRGLTVFMLPIHQEGVEVSRIEMLDGNKEFCQEFLTDVRVPDSARIGAVDDGWTVATRWLFYERSFSSSPFALRPAGDVETFGDPGTGLLQIAEQAGRLHDPAARELVGEAHMLRTAMRELDGRLHALIATGRSSDQIAAVGRLMHGVTMGRLATIGFELAGASAVAAGDDEQAGALGTSYLLRQIGSIGGGTTEIARNVISERVLGMPRELALDRNVPYREVRTAPSSGGGAASRS